MNLSRGRVLALLGAALAVPACGGRGAIRVGSKNFTESILIAEIYAQALERAGYRVVRRLNLGSTQIALAAMQRGDIDLYPEYTGTALIDVLHHAPVSDSREIFSIVKSAFASQYHLTWLEPSPMNDSQGIATTQAIASKFRLRSLSELARASTSLRLATIPEFLSRPDGLPGLQRVYGGFHFASVRSYDIALKYQALLDGQADVATAFTTDGAIASNRLVVLEDDKHLWPAYNVAPVVRTALLARDPKIAATLQSVSPRLRDAEVRRMNAQIENDKADPADVAGAFLRG